MKQKYKIKVTGQKNSGPNPRSFRFSGGSNLAPWRPGSLLDEILATCLFDGITLAGQNLHSVQCSRVVWLPSRFLTNRFISVPFATGFIVTEPAPHGPDKKGDRN